MRLVKPINWPQIVQVEVNDWEEYQKLMDLIRKNSSVANPGKDNEDVEIEEKTAEEMDREMDKHAVLNILKKETNVTCGKICKLTGWDREKVFELLEELIKEGKVEEKEYSCATFYKPAE